MEKKKIGLLSLVSMAAGMVIGAGIFNIMPSIIGSVGKALPLAMTIAVLISLVKMIPMIYITSMCKTKGGFYSAYQMLFPEKLSGVITVMMQVGSISCASLAVGLANYVIQLIPGLSNYSKFIAIAFVLAFYLINVTGTSSSTKVQNVMFAALLIALGIYVITGIPHIKLESLAGEDFFLGGTRGFISAAAMLTTSVSGATMIMGLASDCKNAKRDIPLAIVLGTVLPGVLYVLIAMVTAWTIPVEDVAAGSNLGVVAAALMSQPLYLFFMVGGAIFALATSLNTHITASPYAWLNMAEDGWLPAWMAKRTKGKLQYPYVIRTIIFVLGAFLPIFLGWNVASISAFFTVPGSIINTAVFVAAYFLPKRFPEQWNKSTFKVPMPIYYIFVTLGLIANTFQAVGSMGYIPFERLLIMLALMFIIFVYAYHRYKKGYVKTSREELLSD